MYHDRLRLAVVALVAAAIPATEIASAQCPASFSALTNYGVGTDPSSVAVGDLNADGILDLAVTNEASDTVSVLLGNGSGSFAAPIHYGAGTAPCAVVIADFDGANGADLAVANRESDDISLLLNNGNGTLASAVHLAGFFGPWSLAAGDLNHDQKPDLVVANTDYATFISVLYGNGDGTFAPPVNLETGSSNPSAVAIGDLNNDGHPDLATAVLSGHTVSVRLGNGDGTFGPPANYRVQQNPAGIAVGDVSGDGRADVITTHLLNNISVLLGNGDGTFAPWAYFSMQGSHAESVRIGELTGDAFPDLAIGSHYDGFAIAAGNGDGTFNSPVRYDSAHEHGSVAIGDLNSDGALDVVATNLTDDTVAAMLNQSVVIARQPVNQAVAEGDTTAFSIIAAGVEDFQWRHNGVLLTDGGPYGGTTTDTLTITGASASEAGVYDVRLSVVCDIGIFSQPVSLGVSGPVCRGDMNNDHFINGADVQSFVQALLEGGSCP